MKSLVSAVMMSATLLLGACGGHFDCTTTHCSASDTTTATYAVCATSSGTIQYNYGNDTCLCTAGQCDACVGNATTWCQPVLDAGTDLCSTAH